MTTQNSGLQPDNDQAEQFRKLETESQILTVVLLAVFGIGILGALKFSQAGGLFPLTVSIAGFLLCLLQIAMSQAAKRKPPTGGEPVYPDVTFGLPPEIVSKRMTRFMLWIGLLFAGIWLFGFKIAVPLYFIAYLRIEAKAKWGIIALLVLGSGYLIFYHLSEVLGVIWPTPAISRVVPLPDFLL